MSKKTTLAAGTSPFAHLLGGAAALAGRALGRRAEEDEPKPDAEEGDEQDADADQDEPDAPEEGKKGRKAKGAADDDGDESDAEEGDDDVDAEDEDADEPEGKKASASYKRGFAAANKRAAAIFACPAAGSRPDLAAQFAFGTRMSSAEAIGMLTTATATPAGKRSRSLDDRMGSRTEPRPGAGSGTTGGKQGEQSFADQVAAANKKAGR